MSIDCRSCSRRTDAGTTRVVAAAISTVIQLDRRHLSDRRLHLRDPRRVHRLRSRPARRPARGAIKDTINDQTVQGLRVGQRRRVRPVRDRVHRQRLHAGQRLPAGARPRGRARGSCCSRACRPAPPARSTSTRSPAATRRRTTTASRSACSAACSPAGTPRDRCGPPATEPARGHDPAVGVLPGQHAARQRRSRSTSRSASTSRSSTQFAYAGYDGGLLCLTIGGQHDRPAVDRHARRCFSRSLGKLVESNSPMAVGLRPQSPPMITLGKNTFIDDGMGNMIARRAAARHHVQGDGDRLLRVDRRPVRPRVHRGRRRPPADRPAGHRRWASSRR